MSYVHANVTLTPGQAKTLQSKHSNSCGTRIALKQTQLAGDPNKLSLTKTKLNHFNKAKAASKGVRFDFTSNSVTDMVKTGGIFPLLAAIPALIATAAPAVPKAAALGSIGTSSGMTLKKITRKGYKKKKGSGLRLPGTSASWYPKC